MKFVLILSIAITSFVIALNYINHIKMHLKAVNQCINMIETIEILLSYKNLSVNEIFNCLSQNSSLYLLDFIKKINYNLSSTVSNYILCEENKKIIMSCKYINVNDKENLISFFATLGKSDLNGQILNCKTYKEIFKKIAKKLEKTEVSDCKSSGIMILGIGFLLIILLL